VPPGGEASVGWLPPFQKNKKNTQELNAVFLILDIYKCPFFDFFKKHLVFFEFFDFVTIMKN
jgi:hypothetical protein